MMMNKLQEFVHAYDTIRRYNDIVDITDASLAALSNEDVGGYSTSKPLTELKTEISQNCSECLSRFDVLDRYIDAYADYDLRAYSPNHTHLKIKQGKILSDAFQSNLTAEVLKTEIDDTKKLTEIRNRLDLNLIYAIPVTLSTSYHYAIIMNDWLDAVYHICSGRDFNTGIPKVYPEKEKVRLISGMLQQFDNLSYLWPGELSGHIGDMRAARNYCLANIGKWDEMKRYLNDNIPRLPLYRRRWAIDNGD